MCFLVPAELSPDQRGIKWGDGRFLWVLRLSTCTKEHPGNRYWEGNNPLDRQYLSTGTERDWVDWQLCPVLDFVEEGNSRMVSQLTSMLDNPSHPIQDSDSSTFLSSSLYIFLLLVEMLYSLLFVYSHVFLLCMHVFVCFFCLFIPYKNPLALQRNK